MLFLYSLKSSCTYWSTFVLCIRTPSWYCTQALDHEVYSYIWTLECWVCCCTQALYRRVDLVLIKLFLYLGIRMSSFSYIGLSSYSCTRCCRAIFFSILISSCLYTKTSSCSSACSLDCFLCLSIRISMHFCTRGTRISSSFELGTGMSFYFFVLNTEILGFFCTQTLKCRASLVFDTRRICFFMLEH